jgi:hypothetical protein
MEVDSWRYPITEKPITDAVVRILASLHQDREERTLLKVLKAAGSKWKSTRAASVVG